jgi:hypothetical protein
MRRQVYKKDKYEAAHKKNTHGRADSPARKPPDYGDMNRYGSIMDIDIL